MFINKKFKEYKLLDCGDKEKLENWNGIILRRPDPLAIWPREKNDLWQNTDGYYHRKNGGGYWQFFNKIPDNWFIHYKELTFKITPTDFKHTGLFPEQASNWDFIYEKIKSAKENNRPAKILNLFAYTGAASIVAALAGSEEVVHVDASKGMVNWAKENMLLSNLGDRHIRFIVDDCLKFIKREYKRGRIYDGIIMDPPSYGRGPNKELFKFEDMINELIAECLKILSPNPLFMLISSYTTGYSTTVMYNVLKRHLAQANLNLNIDSQEIGIAVSDSQLTLPCGITTRIY